jgi:hypothetical protein
MPTAFIRDGKGDERSGRKREEEYYCGRLCKRTHLSSTPRALGSRQAAARKAASRESHPSVVLTEPPPLRCLWLDGSTIVLLAVMAVQEAISAFGPAWIARSFQMSWRAAGTVAHTKIEVSVNAYAVIKVQRRFFSPH